MFEVKITINLKPTVNNPEGLTIKSSLESLGFSNLNSVRVGKNIIVKIDSDDKNEVILQVEEMCSKLLANPIIEQYEFDINQI
ncbi:MAG: phosphoribosylformylglycinamidine synthase subunit PurS [Chloroflexi bacterium]|nr:phosphoribosylformylglycinamidine synthase subunit PurS [Chloroflexota bacterium]MCH2305021.1 phosphoribosylformylglycinamidine synthase subunit PurS [SAR202 cluster bacterium]